MPSWASWIPWAIQERMREARLAYERAAPSAAASSQTGRRDVLLGVRMLPQTPQSLAKRKTLLGAICEGQSRHT